MKGTSKTTKINETIICAGFGGQGIMVLGKFLANAAMKEGFNVTWLPSYGAEVRGGTAHSDIRISSSFIGSPMVSDPDVAIIMNEPSQGKFEDKVKKGGLLILNSSLSSRRVSRNDIRVINIPLTDEAIKLGNIKVANIIAAGVYAKARKIFDKKTLVETIEIMAGGKKELADINMKAIEKGMELADQHER